MTTKSKFAAALAALTLAATVALPAAEAEARPRFGTGLAVGLIGGALIGGAIASQAHAGPVYHSGPVYVSGRRCRWVSQFDYWGNYMGRARVCHYY